MRFSLLTLMLLTIWLGCALAVWVRRAPWIREHSVVSPADFEQRFPNWIKRPLTERLSAPDRCRIVATTGASGSPILDTRYQSSEILYRLNGDYRLDEIEGFLDNNTVVIATKTPYVIEPREVKGYIIWHRRYPEWWWGHVYRPEVWVLIGLTLVITLSGVKRFRSLPAIP